MTSGKDRIVVDGRVGQELIRRADRWGRLASRGRGGAGVHVSMCPCVHLRVRHLNFRSSMHPGYHAVHASGRTCRSLRVMFGMLFWSPKSSRESPG